MQTPTQDSGPPISSDIRLLEEQGHQRADIFRLLAERLAAEDGPAPD